MSEQLTIVLRRDGDGWALNADVGEPGREHARRVGAQRFTVSHENASLGVGILVGATGDGELAQRVREFVGPG